MNSLTTLALFALTSLALAACNDDGKPVTMADSFDLDIFGPHEDTLHSPYVAGAQFQITAVASNGQSNGGWTLSSSDPNVIEVTSAFSDGDADVTARNPGVATLTLTDASGTVLDTHQVVVGIPDTVKLYAQGPLLTGASDDEALVTQANIVEGGEATFLVRYFAQGTELYGSGALTPTGTKEIAVNTASTSFASARDFLQVTPAFKTSTGTVSLAVDHTVVGELTVNGVPAKAVALVTMLAQSTDNANTGDSLVLYAHAVDGTLAEVYGASFNWLINGTSAQASIFDDGPADLFFYDYDPTVAENVTASYDGFNPYAIVHGKGGSVGSTADDLGCALSGTPGALGGVSSMFSVALAVGGIAFVRRRRVVGSAAVAMKT